MYYQRLEYSAYICFYDLSFVSITNFKLKMKDIPHHAAKNTKRIAGFFYRMFSVRIGNKIITSEAHIQFVAVEKDTILG